MTSTDTGSSGVPTRVRVSHLMCTFRILYIRFLMSWILASIIVAVQ